MAEPDMEEEDLFADLLVYQFEDVIHTNQPSQLRQR